MKRQFTTAVATAKIHRNRQLTQVRRAFSLALAAAALMSGNSIAHAFGGGEYIVSSQVVSDTAVGGDAGSGGCAGGDCGGSVLDSSGSGGQYVGDGTYDDGEFVVGGSAGMGGVNGRQYGQPDLFYNFYTQGQANSANAQMYVSPVPVPPNSGHTHLTYQPFYPHELLYWHTDKFHNYYDNGRGHNRTHVKYYSPPIKQAASNFYWNVLRIAR